MKIRNLVAAVGIAAMSATSAMAAVIDLGFSLDASGSVGSTNFNTTRTALAAALVSIPTTGANEYRIAVTTFSNGVTVVVPPTIVTPLNLAAIQADVAGAAYTGGITRTDLAINNLTSLFANTVAGASDTQIFNITTDGNPYGGPGNDQLNAEAAAAAARAAGVDGISFEAIGGNVNLNDMSRIAGIGTSGDPNAGVIVNDLANIPNATDTGFVIAVTDFTAYQAAIDAKIQKVVIDIQDVPLPAGLPLLLVGMGAFGLMRRKQQAA